MALKIDLDPGDIIVVPPNSGAQITVKEKTGRRTRVEVESAVPVQVLRGRDTRPREFPEIPRPRPQAPGAPPTPPRAQVPGPPSSAKVLGDHPQLKDESQ